MGSWLERILAVACLEQHGPVGRACGIRIGIPGGDIVCAFRIQAAEEAAKPGPAVIWRFTTEQFTQFLINGELTRPEAEQIVRDQNPPRPSGTEQGEG